MKPKWEIVEWGLFIASVIITLVLLSMAVMTLGSWLIMVAYVL